MIAQLNDLLDAELNSVFAFLGRSMPYLDRDHASMHKNLAAMVASSQQRAERLNQIIESLGGSPIPRGLRASEQHLAYLTIQFLLPMLINAKKQDIRRYLQVARDVDASITNALNEMVAEQGRELELLEKNFAKVSLSKM